MESLRALRLISCDGRLSFVANQDLFSERAARANDRACPTNGSDRGCARSNLIR
jgi:hypothetical protein